MTDKKNFTRTLAAHVAHLTKGKLIELRFQDEARIGQKNGRTRIWARKGTRPRLPADQRYKNTYLFGAICPKRGVGVDLSRFDAAPMIAFTVTKETNYWTETDGGIPPRCGPYRADERTNAETDG